MSSKRHITIVVLSALLVAVCAQSPFAVPDSCSDTTQRFDVSSLSCVSCGSGKSSDSTGEQCLCDAGYERVDDPSYDITLFTCSACTAGTVSLSDGTGCIDCGNSTLGSNSTTNDCDCTSEDGPGYILVERDQAGSLLTAKECVACPSHGRVFPSVDAYICELCPHTAQTMDSDGVCTCGVGYTQAGDSCVLTSLVANVGTLATEVLFKDIRKSDSGNVLTRSAYPSYVFTDNYLAVAVNCREYRIREACQFLINMCAMEMYNAARPTCQKMAEIDSLITTVTHGFAGWKDGLPFFDYDDVSVLSSTELASKVSLNFKTDTDARSTVSNLKFMLARYALNGSYLGLEELEGQLQLCGEAPSRITDYLRFGTSYENECELKLYPYVVADEPVFYDLYIVDVDGTLFPVPVQIENYRDSSGSLANSGSPTKLHRRFFLYDNVSSKPRVSDEPEVLSYAKYIFMSIRMRSGSETHIYPPLLTIKYAQREVSRISSTSSDSSSTSHVTFKTEYTKDINGFWLAATILLALALALIAILWLKAMYKYSQTNPIAQVDCTVLVVAGSFAMSIMADVFFWLTFILTGYCFIFYKGQATAFFLLPSRSSREVYLLTTFVVLCFFGKLFDIVYKIWQQIHVDIFFMDWEKPRGSLADFSHAEVKDDTQEKPLPVSVWRKVFIANRWTELQTARVVNISLTLFFLLLFLRGIGLEYLATAQPTFGQLDSDAAPIHPLLRFAVTTFFWLAIVGCQIVFNRLFYRRYVEDKAANFVDLLAVTNISCFLLDERFHGYYIHGKTVHAHADTSLEELSAQIASEKKNWTKSRGLMGGKDSFELYVSRQFRARFDKVYTAQLNRELKKQQMEGRRRTTFQTRTDNNASQDAGDQETNLLISEKLLAANGALNEFLQSFVEKTDPNYPWEEGVKSFFERRFNLAPAMPARETNISMMYEDQEMEFTKTTLLGIEFDLVKYLILWYSAIDLAFSNTFVSILLTFLMDRIISSIRYHWGKINVARKTLVDSRFLS